MELEKKKFVFDIVIRSIMVLLFVVSVTISIISYNTSDNAKKIAGNAIEISEKSNQIASEALDTSKYQFIQVNRPYIILSPKRYDNGQFWELTQKDKEVEVNLKYKIKNVGNVAAKNISLPDKLVVGPKMKLKKGASTIFQKPGKITLGPRESYTTIAQMRMVFDDVEEAKKFLVYLVSDKSEGALFQLSVNYTNELDESQRYRTFVMNRIHNDNAKIIKSEMLNIYSDSEESEK